MITALILQYVQNAQALRASAVIAVLGGLRAERRPFVAPTTDQGIVLDYAAMLRMLDGMQAVLLSMRQEIRASDLTVVRGGGKRPSKPRGKLTPVDGGAL